MKTKYKFAIVIVVAISILAIGILLIPTTASYSAAKLTHAQELWLSVLEWCESRGDPSAKVLDSNDKYSYGAFQFQMSTFLAFGKEYGFIATSTTPEQGESLIYDYQLQKKIVTRMVENGLESHWLVCYRRIGDYPKNTM